MPVVVQVSSDRKAWKEVECGRTYTANSDMFSKVINMFDKPVLASYVRILPQTWYGWMSMRAGLLLCERPCVDKKLDYPMTDSLLSITKGRFMNVSNPHPWFLSKFATCSYIRPWT